MCRFAVVKSREPFSVGELLEKFAISAKSHPAPDGDKQEDGWGAAWKNGESWEIFRSINPIWEEKAIFKTFPKTTFAIFHARSATYKSQKGLLHLNQPYFQEDTLFVFNGAISKVRLKLDLYGEVGARKIFSMILKFEKELGDLNSSIWRTFQLIRENSEKIKGLNLAVIREERIYGFNYFEEAEDYYQLWMGRKDGFLVISSNKFISGLDCSKAPFGEVFEVG